MLDLEGVVSGRCGAARGDGMLASVPFTELTAGHAERSTQWSPSHSIEHTPGLRGVDALDEVRASLDDVYRLGLRTRTRRFVLRVPGPDDAQEVDVSCIRLRHPLADTRLAVLELVVRKEWCATGAALREAFTEEERCWESVRELSLELEFDGTLERAACAVLPISYMQASGRREEHRVPPSAFQLSVIKDAVAVHPAQRVLHTVGLCTRGFDLAEVRQGKVEVRLPILCVFRPSGSEVILAKIKSSDEDVTVGFFSDVYVPLVYLPDPRTL
ncbi:uncharacterized protein BXZ73DRAFT_107045 [Epithele typhae]|uniref:uncharacterized protein n=1 Tax=Epithele typhae TaxID=378194 RepID=UPI002008B088|nr:uncharacterized protein BXZ73DRAFT_107045 [Epithele typhae]KAH9913069.1 hypothetical protein BXZ73DRAFT_107045 [Epithele typhae]